MDSARSTTAATKKYLLHRLPTWITTNLNKSSFKLLARCWIASWASFLLMIPSRSLHAFGTATFFACMSSFFLPPAYPVHAFFYATGIMAIGALLGWAWGCAAMAAALAARNQVVLLSEIERAQQKAATAANPDAMFALQIFQGNFLDTRSSIVYGVFLAIGCFFFAISRAYSQKFILFSLFGTIYLDIICSFGPLLPVARYTIVQTFATSTAAYVAIGCASIIIFFPESLNHQILGGISKLLCVLREQMEIQERVLKGGDADGLSPDSTIAAQIQGMTADSYGRLHKLVLGAGLLPIEFSFGKFNNEDIKNVIQPLNILVSRMAGLQNFSKLIGGDPSFTQTQSTTQSESSSIPANAVSASDHPTGDGDGYVLRHLAADKQLRTPSVITATIHPSDILPLLHTATSDLRNACIEALSAASAFITHTNSTRWRRGVQPTPELDAPLDTLRGAIEAFTQTRRLEIIDPYIDLASPEKEGPALPRRVLFYALVFQANMVWCAEAIVLLVEILAETAQKRPRARLWAPKGIRLLWKILTIRDVADSAELDEGAPPDDLEDHLRMWKVDKRDPDSSPPKNTLQQLGNLVFKAYSWSMTSPAIYSFKYTFVSVALWLPAVFKTSAYTYYANKGVWAVIMAQTTLEPFIADQIYSFVARVAASTVGIVIGLVVWYIGAGGGGGNPYGIAAAMGVALIPLMFWRVFCPSVVPPMLCAVTVILIIGFSWNDTHLLLIGNPGVGWSVAWRRWLLVLIGSGASAAVMFIPPKSARTAVRIGNASIIHELSRLYGILISRWIMAETGNAGEKSAQQRRKMGVWSAQLRADFSAVGAKIQALKTRTSLARWEGSFRGVWALEKYSELNKLETEMLSFLAQLAGAIYHLDPEWRQRLLHRTKFLNPNFITEVMSVFTIVSRSLRTGETLQETLPKCLLDRVFYHHGLTTAPPGGEGETRRDHWDQFRSLEFMSFATGVTAVYEILSLLDRMREITADLCGEVEIRGLAEWRKTHEEQSQQPRT